MISDNLSGAETGAPTPILPQRGAKSVHKPTPRVEPVSRWYGMGGLLVSRASKGQVSGHNQYPGGPSCRPPRV